MRNCSIQAPASWWPNGRTSPLDRQFTPANTEDGPYVPTRDCPSNTAPRRDAPTVRSVGHSTALQAITGVTTLDEPSPIGC
jgi:hypothetical protein